MRQTGLVSLVVGGVLACLNSSQAKPLQLLTVREGGKARHLIPLEGFGATPNDEYMPLGECQGDCDEDSDCKSGLKCFQREPGEDVPGCEGGAEAMSRTDYCYRGEGGATSPHDQSPQEQDSELPELVGYGGDPSEDFIPLGECEGDCDNDAQCEESLICYQRTSGWPVPGCSGALESETDFCVKRPADYDGSGSLPQLVGGVSVSGSADGKLALCEGDCDSDKDCEDNLVCYQREPGWPVPGCQGNSDSRTDFCVSRPSDRNSGGSSSSHSFNTNSDSQAAAIEEQSGSGASRRVIFAQLIAALISPLVLFLS